MEVSTTHTEKFGLVKGPGLPALVEKNKLLIGGNSFHGFIINPSFLSPQQK
jgi:hypothetical protein